jgi:hypothetical protein
VTFYPNYSRTDNVSLCTGETYTLPNGTVVGQTGTYISNLTTVRNCDSVITTVITVYSNYSRTDVISRCQGDTYVLPNGTIVSVSGTYVSNLITVRGCDSVITSVVTFYQNFSRNETVSRCQGQSYVLPSGTTVTLTGTYVSNLTTVRGCDSVITSFVTFYPTYARTDNVQLCQGETYTLASGTVVSQPGTYVTRLVTVRGCDSVITAVVSVYSTYSRTDNISRCQGDSYVLPNGTTVTTSGTYISSLTSASGCDSVITSVVTFYQNYSSSQTVSRCQGQSYLLPDGRTVTVNGSYVSNLSTVRSCDSIITSNVTFYPVYSSTVPATTCQGSPYTLPNGTSVSLPGSYTTVLTTVRGCDSTIITNLTVFPEYTVPDPASICQGQSYQLPDGRTVTAAGSYTSTLSTVDGCDSVINTTLTVNPVYNIYRTASICDNASYTLPNGQVVNLAGTYPVTLSTVRGCDSTIVTSLSVRPSYSFLYYASICQGQTYTLPNGQIVDTTGVYTVTFLSSRSCDSTIITDLTVDPTYSTSRSDSICQGEQFVLPNGSSVGVAGTYTVTLASSRGCDSTIVTQLAVNPIYGYVSYSATICQGEVHFLPNNDTASVSGIYPVTIPSSKGCDSTVFTTLTVNPVYDTQVNASICQYETYVLPDGGLVDSSGSYTRLLSTVRGCDSLVTVHLTVNPVYATTQDAVICQGQLYQLPGGSSVYQAGNYIDTVPTSQGCDSVITTNLTVNPSYRFTEYRSVCQGDSFVLGNGTAVYTAGTYTVSFSTLLSCDSTIITNLTILPVFTTMVDTTICAGDSYLLADSSTVEVPGAYPVVLQSIRGCDSTVITNLSLRPVYTVHVFDTICQGDVIYLPDGQPAYATGSYPVTLTSSVACDSTVITNLQVNRIYNINRNVTICQGSTFQLPDGQIVTAPGTYPVVLRTIYDCDSLVVTNLTVRPNYTINRSISICQGDTFYLPNGFPVTTAGIYTNSFLTVYGCDSVIRTIVNVRPVYTIYRTAQICQGDSYQLPGGSTVTNPGVYTRTFQTAFGCDSVIITTLTVNQNYAYSENVSICQGSSYALPNNTIVSNPGTYLSNLTTVFGCDSVITTHLSVSNNISNTFRPSICQGETYVLPSGQVIGAAGTYYFNYLTSSGCDSAVTIILSVYPNYYFQLSPSICQGESYTLPDGIMVSTSGVYQVNLQGRGGCDSSYTINLTVNNSYSGIVNATVCQGQSYALPDGRQVSLAGSYLSSFVTPFGCDSVILTLLQVVPPSVWNQSVDLCLGETYVLPDGTPVSTDGVYQSTVSNMYGCDSLIFTFVTTVGFMPDVIQGTAVTNHWATETYSVTYVAGHFYTWTALGGQIVSGQGTNSVQVVWNRNSVDTLILSQFDTQCDYQDTLIVDVIFTSVASPSVEGNPAAFPVPFTDRLTVTWPRGMHPTAVTVHDLSGRIILEVPADGLPRVELSTGDLASGCYLIGLKGESAPMIRVIRQ